MRYRRLYTLIVVVSLLIVFELYLHIHPSVSRTDRYFNATDQKEGAKDFVKNGNYTFERNITENMEKTSQRNLTENMEKTSQTDIHSSVKPHKSITVAFMGRLGNLLFEYASLCGIARRNNLIPIVPASLTLFKYFHIHAGTIPNYRMFPKYSKQYHEKKGCTFEPDVMNFGSGSDVTLHGYFQSWKYFDFVKKEIRENFQWKEPIASDAVSQLVAAIQSKRYKQYVGVHVRRGDMVHSVHMTNYGYIAADKDYLIRAMNHFRTKFSDLVFIVVSDDIEWCSRNINGDDVRFVTKKNPAEVDMAILTMCNHTVMTTGSYGWWSAWLAGGDVVFYNGYPRSNSTLFSEVTPADYRPPSWIGM